MSYFGARRMHTGYPFQVKFNFVDEVLQMSPTDASSLGESTSFRLPVTLRTSVTDKARLSYSGTDAVEGVTRLNLRYKRGDLKHRQFASLRNAIRVAILKFLFHKKQFRSLSTNMFLSFTL